MTPADKLAKALADELRNAGMMVNYGNGDVRVEPDPLHERAADEIERLTTELTVEREITANLTWAIERLNQEAEQMVSYKLVKALETAIGHLEEMRLDPKWHPIAHCPVLDQTKAALAEYRAAPQPRPVRYVRFLGHLPDLQETTRIRHHPLFQIGDTVLVWVNEGDLYGGSAQLVEEAS